MQNMDHNLLLLIPEKLEKILDATLDKLDHNRQLLISP